jgi:hypothetical protein
MTQGGIRQDFYKQFTRPFGRTYPMSFFRFPQKTTVFSIVRGALFF